MEQGEVLASALEEALRHVEGLRDKVVVVKVGGSTLGSQDTTSRDLVTLQRLGVRLVVVHGVGATISEWLKKTGLEPKFVGGLRVTDEATLDVALMVLAGKVNKELVAEVQGLGGKAVGICGADGSLLVTRQRSAELGLVGDITEVRPELLNVLLEAGYMPVIAPIGVTESGQLLNINADTVAAEVAVALGAQRLIFLTDVPGILDQNGKLLSTLSQWETQDLISRKVISGGMIPKAEGCLRCVGNVGSAHITDGRVLHALLRELLTEQRVGTAIV